VIIGSSLIGVLWFILTIYVLYLIITGSADSTSKLIWVLLVLFLPVLGPILYLLIGPGHGGAVV
jgi:hypothetical protein